MSSAPNTIELPPTVAPSVTVSNPLRRLVGRLTDPRTRTVTITTGVSLACFGVMAIQGALLARLLGPEARGEYGTAIFYTQLLTTLGTLGTIYSIARRAARNPEQRATLASASLRTGFVTGLLTFLAVALLAAIALPGAKRALAPLCLVSGLLLPMEHIRLALLSVDQGAGRFSRYNVNRFIAAAALPAILVPMLAMHVHASISTYVWLTVLATFIGLVAAGWSSQAKLRTATPAPPARELIREGLPYFAGLTASNLFCRIDNLLVLLLGSFVVQGLYTPGSNVTSVLVVIPNTMAVFAFNAAAKSKGGRRTTLGKLIVQTVCVQIVTSLALAAVLKPLILLAFGRSFTDAVPLAMAQLPASGINGLALVLEGYVRGLGRPKAGVVSRFIGAVAALIVAYPMYHSMGIIGIPLAYAVGQTVCVVWIVREAHRAVPATVQEA